VKTKRIRPGDYADCAVAKPSESSFTKFAQWCVVYDRKNQCGM